MSWRFGLGGSGCGFGCEQAADVDLGLNWSWGGGRGEVAERNVNLMSVLGGVQDVAETDVGDGVNNGAQIEAG